MATRYNARDPMTARRIKAALVLLLLLMLLAALPPRSRAEQAGNQAPAGPPAEQAPEDWNSVAARLAEGIVSVTGQSLVSISLENDSSLRPSEVAAFRAHLLVQLSQAGVRPSQPSAAAYQVKVRLTESLRGRMLVAETAKASGEPAVIVLAAPQDAASSDPPQVALRKLFLIRQEQPVLDVALFTLNDEPALLALAPDHVALFRLDGNAWRQASSADLPIQHALPRDTRGRLVTTDAGAASSSLPSAGASFAAYLPGAVCNGALNPLGVNCREADDPWPLAGGSPNAFFNSARNLFTGGLSPPLAEAPGSFYSAAYLHSATNPARPAALVTVSADSRVRMYAGGETELLPQLHVGSEIAALRSSCGSEVVLGAGAGDYEAGDALRAYDLGASIGSEVASDPVEFPGPVVVLWTAAGNSSAIAVTHNLKTGSYEAYSVTATCLR